MKTDISNTTLANNQGFRDFVQEKEEKLKDVLKNKGFNKRQVKSLVDFYVKKKMT